MLSRQKLGLLLLISGCLMPRAYSQRVYDTTTTNLMIEMSKVQAYLHTTPDLGFNAVYYYDEFDGEVTHYDTMQASYLINDNKFHIVLDSVRSVQNEKYLVTVYPEDSTVVVQQPAETFKKILQVDVLDSSLQQFALASMSAADSGAFRKITLHFDSDAPYKSYEVVFNRTSLHLIYLKCSLRKDLEPDSQRETNLRIQFSSFITEMPVGDPYSLDPYVRILSGSEATPGTLTPNFEVINLLNK